MGALKAREVPFGSNVSRVLKVGKKFAPKMTAKMIEMGEDAVKKMGWVSEVMEDGTEAVMVRAGTWAWRYLGHAVSWHQSASWWRYLGHAGLILQPRKWSAGSTAGDTAP